MACKKELRGTQDRLPSMVRRAIKCMAPDVSVEVAVAAKEESETDWLLLTRFDGISQDVFAEPLALKDVIRIWGFSKYMLHQVDAAYSKRVLTG